MDADRAQDIVSLSARRAWIEIIEEVSKYVVKESLSARRAWIEINSLLTSVVSSAGSLSARRAWIEILESKQIDPSVMRRSPQGERG